MLRVCMCVFMYRVLCIVVCASVDGSVCEWMDVCLRVCVCALMCASSVDGSVCEWMDVCVYVCCAYVCVH